MALERRFENAPNGRLLTNKNYNRFTEEVTKASSAIWSSLDGSLVMYVQYDDSAVSEVKFPRIADGIGGMGATRAGFLLPAFNHTMHTVFPDHITIRYPTVSNTSWFLYGNNKIVRRPACRKVRLNTIKA